MYHSKIINQNFKINPDKSIQFDDQVYYSPEEVKLISGSSDEVIKMTHGVKKMFNGVVVK